MEETNRKIIITLMIIVLLLCTLFILAITGEISIKPKEKVVKVQENEKVEKEVYTYKKIKGLYSFKEEEKRDSSGYLESNNYYLYLYDNGTFNYRIDNQVPNGRIGNYIIEDNKIKLNVIYNYGSGVGLHYNGETSEITINNDGTLNDINNLVTKANITLTKNETDEIKKNFETKTFNDLIKSEFEMNQAMLKNK